MERQFKIDYHTSMMKKTNIQKSTYHSLKLNMHQSLFYSQMISQNLHKSKDEMKEKRLAYIVARLFQYNV